MTTEEEVKVTINQEDLKNIEDFFKHFEIEMPAHLVKTIDTLKNKSDFEYSDQLQLQGDIAQTIVESKAELFQDELFENVVKNCQDVDYNRRFNKDLEEILSEEDQDSGTSGT